MSTLKISIPDAVAAHFKVLPNVAGSTTPSSGMEALLILPDSATPSTGMEGICMGFLSDCFEELGDLVLAEQRLADTHAGRSTAVPLADVMRRYGLDC